MRLLFLLFIVFPSFLFSNIYIRCNEAGYKITAKKVIIVMSDSSLEGSKWTLKNSTNVGLLSGIVGQSETDSGTFMPMRYNYKVDVSSIQTKGIYQFEINTQTKKIVVGDSLYQKHIQEILSYYLVQRSGSSDSRDHKISHLRDSACVVYERVGDANNSWQKRKETKLVNMLGGWYDAGDYLKFTLTIAYSTYQLLRAYEINPSLFSSEIAKSGKPKILEEAKWGLDYLMKAMPDSNTFIIQEGNHIDHRVGDRMPEDDMLDGARGAYSCLSKAHMAYTAATLALAANVYKKLGELEMADKYQIMAEKIFVAARKSSYSSAWYEFETETFYSDESAYDNMGLAIAELCKLTQKKEYKLLLEDYSKNVGAGSWFAWGNYNTMVNLRIHEYGAVAALGSARSDMKKFAYQTMYSNNLWGAPHEFTWGTLYSFLGVASSSLLYTKQAKDSTYLDHAFCVVDYLFGRNNWGVSFVVSPQLPNSVRNIYSQVYRLQPKLMPVGAVAEGPGDMKSHLEIKQYYSYSTDNHVNNKFNTSQVIFYDEKSDFQCMETTISGLSDAILFLTLFETHVH